LIGVNVRLHRRPMMQVLEGRKMNEYFFGLHPGHLCEQADRIARRRGGRHVNVTGEDGECQGWFAVPCRGSPFDQLTAAEIMSAVERAGGVAALMHR
jgi:hypothetical protein